MDLPATSPALAASHKALIDFECANKQIFRNLSLVLTDDQVSVLLKAVRAFPQEHISSSIDQHRQNSEIAFVQSDETLADLIVASCAASVQLSLLTQCLTESLATSSAVESMLRARVSKQHDTTSTIEFAQQESPYNAGSPFRSESSTATICSTNTVRHFCITCDKSFTNFEALKKHQTEFCERKLDWICPECPDQIFGLQDRLNRHHCKTHAETCPHGCFKGKTYPSEYCKKFLSQCCRSTVGKKAWGCPCCINCFGSSEAWDQHKAIHLHRTQNEKVEDWSFSTMVRSLLYQEALGPMLVRFPWSRCDWSGLGKGDCQRLKLALERHVLPAAVSQHPDYARLDFQEALALYAFRLGVTGKACTELIGHTRSGVASTSNSPQPSHHITPDMTSPVCHFPNVTSQPQDWFDKSSRSVHSANTQSVSSSLLADDFVKDSRSVLSENTQSVSSSLLADDLDHEELMTWNTFIREYSPAEDAMNGTPHNGIGSFVEDQQQPSLPSAFMRNDSDGFPGHQQTTSHSARPGFRNRFRRVIEEGLHPRHIH